MDRQAISLQWLEAQQTQLRNVNRQLWAFAEPALKEYQSSALLAD